ncbi:ABC transporter ATP-binding protein [Actinomadura montaniterrae]|uniref:ABC transporter ATP-binding protein n=1 Tax=Actinomadura montaniterrae TaxID=1803903 RepID=A0A6L3VXP8_9ACTN|nr:ABC transporter ATP-binding protein [Actinomadura montaniterrae]KAB2385968.1 ABC transporter ATP-binding protein [Actinomadura montaniterrae]
MTLLEVSGLYVSYGPIDAVRGASISVERGDVVAIVGPNGAGKSSILQAIQGLVRVRAGSVRWRGTDITGWAPERRARAGIAFVPESRGVFRTLSIGENLRLAGCALAADVDVSERVRLALRYFPALTDRLSERAAVLSGGERQQLAIGRALVAAPELLILDEPSLGLAPVVLDELFAGLARLRDEGWTILLVEQNVARAVKLADHLFSLRGGVIERVSDPGELLRNPSFRAKHLGLG